MSTYDEDNKDDWGADEWQEVMEADLNAMRKMVEVYQRDNADLIKMLDKLGMEVRLNSLASKNKSDSTVQWSDTSGGRIG